MRLKHIICCGAAKGLLLFLTIAGGSVNAAELAGRVVSVADGDTITVQTDDKRRIRIRLQGIDAPERTQAYSQVSRRNLHEMTIGRIVEFDAEKIDRHGRTIAIVRAEGKDVCLAQIQA